MTLKKHALVFSATLILFLGFSYLRYKEIKNDVESDSNNNSASNPPINDFYYPGAGNIGSSTKTLNLESPDHPNKVTDWYKNKIQSFDLNVNSFVKSSADDKIL